MFVLHRTQMRLNTETDKHGFRRLRGTLVPIRPGRTSGFYGRYFQKEAQKDYSQGVQ